MRKALEPLFLEYKVSVVFTAGDNFYERIAPRNDIAYFVVGAGGMIRQGDIDRQSGLTARAFDTDLTFLAADIGVDGMSFNVISRDRKALDSGRIGRRK